MPTSPVDPARFTIVPTATAHLPSLYRTFDAVAREGRFLAFTQAPPWDDALQFYEGMLRAGNPYFVALDGDRVVGWCDVARVLGETRAHIGVLGVGLLPEVRHQGLGRRLMETTLAEAWSQGLTRIELTVRADNLNAKALYDRLGFETEGLRRRASVVGEDVHDLWGMALLR